MEYITAVPNAWAHSEYSISFFHSINRNILKAHPHPSNSFVNLQFPVIYLYLSLLAIPKVISVFLAQTLLIQRNGRSHTGAGQFVE